MRKAPHPVTPHSSSAPGTMLTRVTMPRTTQRNSLVFESNEFEYLSTGDQYGINQVEVPGLPQLGDFPCRELPEFFLINTVKACDLQRRSIVQHDVEHDGSQQIQGQYGRNKLLCRLSSRNQLTQDRQYFLQIVRITP